MRVFVTGATGFVGSAVVAELLSAGHQVLGLTRSEVGAEALQHAGAEVLHGNLEDLGSLRKGADGADGVIHLAFNYDYSQNDKNVADEFKAVTALAEVLQGSKRPLIVTSATAMAENIGGKPSTEKSPTTSFNPRAEVENLVESFVKRGTNISVVRLSQIHDTHKQGFVSYLLAWARQQGVSAYIGDGSNRWAAAHVSDAARLYRLGLEKAEAGEIYHAVDEEGVTLKAIAEAHGRGLKVPVISIKPEDAEAHFGWIAPFASLDLSSSSLITQQKLNWKPAGPGLIEDLDDMDYFPA